MGEQHLTASDNRNASGTAGDHSHKTRPLIVVLLWLAAGIFFPVLIFSLLVLRSNANTQLQSNIALVEVAVQSISSSVERELQNLQTTLTLLKTAPSLQSGRTGDFYAWGENALTDSPIRLSIFDGDGLALLSGSMLQDQTDFLKWADPLATRNEPNQPPRLSGVFFDKSVNQWAVGMALGVDTRAGGRYILSLSQDAGAFQTILTKKIRDETWNVALLDGDARIIATSDASQSTGASSRFRPYLQARQEPKQQILTEDGLRYDLVYQPIEGRQWSVISWAETNASMAPMWRSLGYLLLLCLILSIGTIFVIWRAGRRITKVVRELVEDATSVGRGEPVVSRDFVIIEAAKISKALSAASHARQQVEAEVRFLMREIVHRSKNQLTVVASMAKQSAKNTQDFGEFQDSFQKRIHGLARSTDLLIAGGAAGVVLRDLIEAQIEPFQPENKKRISIEGPEIRLSNQAAQMLGMAFHELATNAVKYGAFAGMEGKLEVSWRIDGEILRLDWHEHVPEFHPSPERRGFGTEVIERMIGRALETKLSRVMNEDGLEWQFESPLRALRPFSEDDAATAH